jgi:hypothetical protein
MIHPRRPSILRRTSTLPHWDRDSVPRFVLDPARHLAKVLDDIAIVNFRYRIPRRQYFAYVCGITWSLHKKSLRMNQVVFSIGSSARRIWSRYRPESHPFRIWPIN